MSRAGVKDVQAVIETDTTIDVNPFIRTASKIVDQIDAQDDLNLLSTDLLREIEVYLAAGLYAIRDQQYSEKMTEKASAVFQTGMPGPGAFQANDWMRTATALDITGYLKKLSEGRKKVQFYWLGKAPSDQVDYVDRD